jgi:hypothetical protein
LHGYRARQTNRRAVDVVSSGESAPCLAEEIMKLVMFAGTVGFFAVVSLSILAVADILLTSSAKEAETERLA